MFCLAPAKRKSGSQPSKIIPRYRMGYYSGVFKELFLGWKIKFAGWLVAESHRQSATVCSVPNVLLILSRAAKLLSVNNLWFVAVVDLPACSWGYGHLTIPFPRGATLHPHPHPLLRCQVGRPLHTVGLLLCKSFSGCVECLHDSESWLPHEIPTIHNVGIQSHMPL